MKKVINYIVSIIAGGLVSAILSGIAWFFIRYIFFQGQAEESLDRGAAAYYFGIMGSILGGIGGIVIGLAVAALYIRGNSFSSLTGLILNGLIAYSWLRSLGEGPQIAGQQFLFISLIVMGGFAGYMIGALNQWLNRNNEVSPVREAPPQK